MEHVKLTRCKLEVSCLQYIEKMISDHAIKSNFIRATLSEVTIHGQADQIAINFSKLLSVFFHGNLKYLTTENAQEDYIDLVKYFKLTYGLQDRAVIVGGGSYGGMLAAWMRMKDC